MEKFSRWHIGTVNETAIKPTYVYLLDDRVVSFQCWWNTLIIEMCKEMGLLNSKE